MIPVLDKVSIELVDEGNKLSVTDFPMLEGQGNGLESRLPILPIPLESNQAAVISTPMFNWGIHTVVRGDTLWDISEFYLNDPFRYPELARWSNIKNPDLIYPGDEVKYKDESSSVVENEGKPGSEDGEQLKK